MTLKTYSDIIDCCFDHFISNGLNTEIITTIIQSYQNIEMKTEQDKFDYIMDKVIILKSKNHYQEDDYISIIASPHTNVVKFNKNKIQIYYDGYQIYDFVDFDKLDKIDFWFAGIWTSRVLFQTNMNDLRYWAKDRTLFDLIVLKDSEQPWKFTKK